MIRLWRAADDDFNFIGMSLSESKHAAMLYLDNRGYGGDTLYYADIDTEGMNILELTEGKVWRKLGKALGMDPVECEEQFPGYTPGGNIAAVIPTVRDIAVTLQKNGYDWVRVEEDYPADTITWQPISQRAIDSFSLKESKTQKRGNPDMSHSAMTYAAAHAWEREAARHGVSTVARSGRGFMRAYQRAGTFAKLPEAWKRKREAFIARHMAQGRHETLWHNGKPSRRALALIMWAYMPPGKNPAQHGFHDELFKKTIAWKQRGDKRDGAEETMLEIQKTLGGGVMSFIVEHGGDLLWRMTEKGLFSSYGRAEVINKLERVLRVLTNPYGFEREHLQNIVDNAEFMKKDPHQLKAQIDNLLLKYAEEHSKLPVYNRAQYAARKIAVLIGQQKWKQAIQWGRILLNMAKDPAAWVKTAGSRKKNPGRRYVYTDGVHPKPWDALMFPSGYEDQACHPLLVDNEIKAWKSTPRGLPPAKAVDIEMYSQGRLIRVFLPVDGSAVYWLVMKPGDNRGELILLGRGSTYAHGRWA